MAEGRATGIVKNFDLERGYGFIAWSGGKDIFVHKSDVERAGLGVLQEGDRVSFTVEKSPKGLRAINLAREEGGAQVRDKSDQAGHVYDAHTDFLFTPEYLREGYFIYKNDKHYLRAEELDALAMEIAKLLGNKGMKSHQLRRFYNKAKGIDTLLGIEKDFEAIKAHIINLKHNVAYQVGRKVVPDEFQQFITRNVELAVENEISFKEGFIPHFESVLSYFVFYFRE
jgi:cold shock protein